MNMAWSTLADFIDMGGYGLYVWGAFGACAAVIAAEIGSLAARRRALKATDGRRAPAARFGDTPHEAQG